MFVALDKNGNRVYADDDQTYKDCICPYCEKPVIHKKGHGLKIEHFAHKSNACLYSKDRDHLSEWHRRMQAFFPKEQREVRFIEESPAGERIAVHIADVFCEQFNTVIEFQKSPIDAGEFYTRTYFHTRNGRRIAWIFDESYDDINDYRNKLDNYRNGRFEHSNYRAKNGPYKTREYKWPYKRRGFLRHASGYNQDSFSVFIYTGLEGDTIHRILFDKVSEFFDHITISLHDVVMSSDMDINELFYPEAHWIAQEPWKTEFAEFKKAAFAKADKAKEKEKRKKEYEERVKQGKLLKKKRMAEYKELSDREDYWDSLLKEYDSKEKEKNYK